MKEIDLAYLAGIIDGEGCLCANTRVPNRKSREVNPQIVMQMVVAMTDKPLIEWMSEVTGTHKIYEYDSKNIKHKKYYAWRPPMSKVRELLPKLLPYLKLKKEQAEKFISLLELRSRSTRGCSNLEEQLVLQKRIKELNKRGN